MRPTTQPEVEHPDRPCLAGPKHASRGRGFCPSRPITNPQVSAADLRVCGGGLIFLQTDPVEGGNANAYVYPQDPINQTDLTGEVGAGRDTPSWCKHKVHTSRGLMCTSAGPHLGAAVGRFAHRYFDPSTLFSAAAWAHTGRMAGGFVWGGGQGLRSWWQQIVQLPAYGGGGFYLFGRSALAGAELGTKAIPFVSIGVFVFYGGMYVHDHKIQ